MQILFKTKQLNVVSEVFIEFKNSLLFFSLFFFKWDKYVPTVLNFGMNFSQRTLWYCDAISWDIYVPTGLKGLSKNNKRTAVSVHNYKGKLVR